MHFEAKKVIVVGGSAGIGRQVAIDVVDHGGSAVIVGHSKARVDDTVDELTDRRGQAWGIAAELTDREAVADVTTLDDGPWGSNATSWSAQNTSSECLPPPRGLKE
jgi:NAD(P)-dependent dehydrogenase (short-subunit alcohol dehydrogenase family)